MKTNGMRGAFAKGNRKRQAMYLIPNLCTTGNLFCGVFAVLSVFNGDHLAAAIAILVAMVTPAPIPCASELLPPPCAQPTPRAPRRGRSW